jgi:hypothetical protein
MVPIECANNYDTKIITSGFLYISGLLKINTLYDTYSISENNHDGMENALLAFQTIKPPNVKTNCFGNVR